MMIYKQPSSDVHQVIVLVTATVGQPARTLARGAHEYVICTTVWDQYQIYIPSAKAPEEKGNKPIATAPQI